MAYQVFDNGRPADTSPNGAGSQMIKNRGWDCSVFDTIEDAYKYAHEWLGPAYSPCDINTGWEYAYNKNLYNRPYVYSSAGDTIQIKEVR